MIRAQKLVIRHLLDAKRHFADVETTGKSCVRLTLQHMHWQRADFN